MLWYKYWLETRWRLVFAFVYAIFPVPLLILTGRTVHSGPPSEAMLQGFVQFLGFYWMNTTLLLAGSGIRTQPSIRSQKGLHGSTFFTLSLPVSRVRLFGIRAWIGLLETAVVFVVAPLGTCVIFPTLRTYATNADLFKYWVTVIVCASMFYFFGVLLSVVLEDQLQMGAGMCGILALWGLLSWKHIPPRFNVFRAMGSDSPLFAHVFPWTTMSLAVCLTAVLFLVSMKFIQAHEY